MTDEETRRTVSAGRVRLAVREWPAPGRPVVVLVHGYPDDSRVWDYVAAALLRRPDAPHLVAYDVRGAGRSDRPRGRGAYRLEVLADDLAAVLDAVSPHSPAHLVGHDWGSIQLWQPVTDPAMRDRIASFTSVSGPCVDHAAYAMGRLRRQARRAWLRQLRRSAYIGLFQVPVLPELLWRSGLAGRLLARSAGLAARPDPANAVGGLGLYRANFVGRRATRRSTGVPVQLVTALRDAYIGPELLAGVERWAPDLTRREVDAGHWVPLTHPELLASWIMEHVNAHA